MREFGLLTLNSELKPRLLELEVRNVVEWIEARPLLFDDHAVFAACAGAAAQCCDREYAK